MSRLILIIDNNGYRLCNDGRWRGFANFGTEPSAVKTYKSLTAAKRKAHRVWGSVVMVSSDALVERYVEAGGLVIENHALPGKPGHVTVFHAALRDFKVV